MEVESLPLMVSLCNRSIIQNFHQSVSQTQKLEGHYCNAPPAYPTQPLQIDESSSFCTLHVLLQHQLHGTVPQLMWLSGRLMLLVAEVRGSIPAKHRGWSRR